MKFLDTCETRSGSIHDHLKPGLQVGQRVRWAHARPFNIRFQ